MKSKIVEEILYAQRLGGNDVHARTRAIKTLKKYLESKSSKKGFTEDNFLKIWKGLYYCMYMADKPLFQEEVAEETSLLIHSLVNIEQRCLFFKVAMDTFAREWVGIDVFRADKFMMLMCRVLRQMLVCLKKNDWNEAEVKLVVDVLEHSVITPIDQTNSKPMGMKIHLADIIMEELAKIGTESLPHEVIMAFVYPYMKVMAISRQHQYVEHVKRSIFEWLIKQSEQGAENQEDMDFGEYELVPEDNDEEEDEEDYDKCDASMENALDPRAGGVDVILPEIKPDYGKLAHALQSLGALPQVNGKKRRRMYALVKVLREMTTGNYPFAIPLLEKNKKSINDEMMEDAIDRVKAYTKEAKRKNEGGTMSKRQQRVQRMKERLTPPEEEIEVKPLPEADPDNMEKIGKVSRMKKSKFKTRKRLNQREKLKMWQKQNIAKSSHILEKAVTEQLSQVAKDVGIPESVVVIPQGMKKNRMKRKLDDSEDGTVNVNKKKKKKKKKILAELDSNVDVKSPVSNDSNKIEEIKSHPSVGKVNGVVGVRQSESLDLCDGSKVGQKSTTKLNAKKEKKLKKKSIEKSIRADVTASKSPKNKKIMITKKATKSDKDIVPEIISTIEEDLQNGNESPKSLVFNKANNETHDIDTNLNLTESPQNINKSPLKLNKSPRNLSKYPPKKNNPEKESDPWSEPLQDGEIEFDVLSKNTIRKQRRMSLKQTPKKTPATLKSIQKAKKNTPPSEGKKLKICLRNNLEHEFMDYKRVLRNSPQIPYSTDNRPLVSALKATSSPILIKRSMKANLRRKSMM